MKSNKNVIVFGCGQMGSVVASSMKDLGHRVTVVDSTKEAFQNLGSGYDTKSVMNLRTESSGLILDKDVVISCLPYHKNYSVAHSAIELSVPYCDLGGRVDVSESIKDLAKKKGFPYVFTDLGLAPGLVNILGEHGCTKVDKPTDVKMMVGGLPSRKVDNPLGYLTTWSIDGLINEYKDDCLILKNGKVETVRGLDGIENINTTKSVNHEKLEAFYTSGGAAHSIERMQELGVQNCSYKTLRFKGHGKLVKFLMRDCELDDDTMKKIFTRGCSILKCNDSFSFSSRIRDVVILICIVENNSGVRWRREVFVTGGDEGTAMQKATGYSIASAAHLMVNERITPTSTHLRYSDVPFGEFSSIIKSLGIEI